MYQLCLKWSCLDSNYPYLSFSSFILLKIVSENTCSISLGSPRGNAKKSILNTSFASTQPLFLLCFFISNFKSVSVKHFWALPMFQNVTKSLFTQQPFVLTINSFYNRHNVQNIATRVSPIPIINFNSKTFQLLNPYELNIYIIFKKSKQKNPQRQKQNIPCGEQVYGCLFLSNTIF